MAAQSYPPESDPVATALVEALDARVEALEGGGGVIEETDPVAGPALASHIADTAGAHAASAVSVAAPLTEGNAQAELERLSLAVGSGSGLVNAGDYDADTEYGVDDVARVGRRAFVLEAHEGLPPPPPLDDNVPWDGIDYPPAAAQSTSFGRTIGAVGRMGDNVFLGYGDYSANTGPVDVAQVDATDLRAEPTAALSDFQSEQIILFRRLADGRVMAPSVDPRGSVGGHIAERAIDGTWAEHLDVITEGGLHIFDVVEGPEPDLMFAAGSGYEVGTSGDSGAALYKSTDAGATWTLDYIIAGPNAAESNRFYWIAVVGDTVYARNSETGVDGEAERMIRWTLADGWDEVAHDLPSALGPGQAFRDGYVLPAGHWGYSEVRGPLRYFDGTTVTTLADAAVGFDVGDDGALYYCTTGGDLRTIPPTGDLEAVEVATLDAAVVSDLIGMVVLPGEETFVFGGPDAHLRVFTVGQRNPWRPLAPKDVTGSDGRILLNLLPPQGDDGSPGLEVVPFGEDEVTLAPMTGGVGGVWSGLANLYVQGDTAWVLGGQLLDDYGDTFDPDTFAPVAMLEVPAWMTAVPGELAELDTIWREAEGGLPLVMPQRRIRVKAFVNAHATTTEALDARFAPSLIGPNIQRATYSPTYHVFLMSLPFDLVWGDIPVFDPDTYEITSYKHGLSGDFAYGIADPSHYGAMFSGPISVGGVSGYISINGYGIPLSFPLGDRP